MKPVLLTIFLLDKRQEARCEPVSKAAESLRELLCVNGTRPILVKVSENALPVIDVLPKRREL